MKHRRPLVLAAALAVGLASTASAYHLDPRNASVRLHGKITFTPNGGGGNHQPFTCAATIYLKTRKTNVSNDGHIMDISVPRDDCDGISLSFLPWPIAILSKHSGQYYEANFTAGNGDCHVDIGDFTIDKDGNWTLTAGGCLSGSLKSHPTTVIK
jgi:hypothetical protein